MREDVMEAKKVAHDTDGNLSIVMVDGRSFVHGSILDQECAKRDAEIDRLRKERDHWESLVSRADHMQFPYTPI
jgi:hypothetical protein